MWLEVTVAVGLGLAVMGFVLTPFLRTARTDWTSAEPPDPDETAEGQAILGLRELEFDRQTGKVDAGDYAVLKAQYTAEALAGMRKAAREPSAAADSVVRSRMAAIADGTASPDCPRCGPRLEPGAEFCSHCGTRLPTGARCSACRAAIPSTGNYCENCGQAVTEARSLS